jgi:glycosyltransferase involved in cell wall biosynthesis
MLPVVSVFVLSYNRARLLGEAIESIQRQAFPDFEIVVADDASTDGSQELTLELARTDARIVPLLATRNRGIARNWNEGIERCSGHYIAILGGDDVMLPGKLERQVALLDSRQDLGACTHDVDFFDSASGRTLYRFSDRYDPPTDAESLLRPRWTLGREVKCLGSSIMARSDFIRACPFDERFRFYSDNLHLMECLIATGLGWGHIPDVLGRYRLHAEQVTRNSGGLVLEETLLVLAIMAARYPALGRLIRQQRNFQIFKHSLHRWAPEPRQQAMDEMLRIEAGWLIYYYMRVARWIIGSPSILALSKPARQMISLLLGRSPVQRGSV